MFMQRGRIAFLDFCREGWYNGNGLEKTTHLRL